jgi:hypothetical protein
MTSKEFDFFRQGYRIGSLCERFNNHALSDLGYSFKVGYDSKGNYFYLKNMDIEEKTFASANGVIEFLENALKKLRREEDIVFD